MAYVKIVDNIVVQKQPNPQAGFIAAPDDVVCGQILEGGVYVDPPLPAEVLWDRFRAERDMRIAATDWLVLRHRDELGAGGATTLSPQAYNDLLAYRQSLRDLPENTIDPAEPGWPTLPLIA